MRFLIVSEIHHPEELARAEQNASPGQPPLFPPSMGSYFWVRSLRKLGHQVDAFIRNYPAVFGWRERHTHKFTGRLSVAMLSAALAHRLPRAHPDYRFRNSRLITSVERFEPDAILLTGGNTVIFPETLAQIKSKFGCKIIYLSGVSPIVFAHSIERSAAELYDLVVVNDYYHGMQWLELGAPQMEAMPISACDPEYHHPYELSADEQTAHGCDVGFAGTLLPLNLYSNRVKALETVGECGLGIWSIHDLPAPLKPYYRGPALGEQMFRITCGSKIQLNPHGNFMRYGGNLRLFEAAGCGVFQIADDLPGVSKWFTPGETIAIYHDLQHLKHQVAYYLQHDDERRQIAEAARAHVYAHHTYDHRMSRLVELISTL